MNKITYILFVIILISCSLEKSRIKKVCLSIKKENKNEELFFIDSSIFIGTPKFIDAIDYNEYIIKENSFRIKDSIRYSNFISKKIFKNTKEVNKESLDKVIFFDTSIKDTIMTMIIPYNYKYHRGTINPKDHISIARLNACFEYQIYIFERNKIISMDTTTICFD